MDLPILSQNIFSLAILALIVGLLAWVHWRRPHSVVLRPRAPKLGLAYEWSSTQMANAKPNMLSRFPELQTVVSDSWSNDIILIRFGLFNLTDRYLERENILCPIEIYFPSQTTIVSATFGEALNTEWHGGAEPMIEGNLVRLSFKSMSPRSTLIFNFIAKGDITSLNVRGETREHGAITRIR
ncbi:MAG: hypothetical protein VX430_09730 [Pseudomonadota bacterium]|nr:hypothetical protein [Pseudomonadota bacterium]